MTDWKYTLYAGLAAPDKDAANSAYATMLKNAAEASTFGTRLVDANGNTVAFGTASALTAEMLVGLRRILQSGAMPASVRYWVTDAFDGTLLATNHVQSQARIGTMFGWSDALAEIGARLPTQTNMG